MSDRMRVERRVAEVLLAGSGGDPSAASPNLGFRAAGR